MLKKSESADCEQNAIFTPNFTQPVAQLIWVEIPVYRHVIRVQVCGALSPDYIHANGF